jgi:hypothetical protein
MNPTTIGGNGDFDGVVSASTREIAYGADLSDPDGLLEGTGKKLRHIKLRSLEDLQQPAVRTLLEAASKHLPKLDC